MAEGKSSAEAWEAYNSLWGTYHRFQPENESEKIWYVQSLTRLNELGDQRRLRLLGSREGMPGLMWVVLLGARCRHSRLQLFLQHEEYHGPGLDDGRPRDNDLTRAARDPGDAPSLCRDYPGGAGRVQSVS